MYLVVFLKREKATPTVSIGIFPTVGSGTLGQAFQGHKDQLGQINMTVTENEMQAIRCKFNSPLSDACPFHLRG